MTSGFYQPVNYHLYGQYQWLKINKNYEYCATDDYEYMCHWSNIFSHAILGYIYFQVYLPS